MNVIGTVRDAAGIESTIEIERENYEASKAALDEAIPEGCKLISISRW